MHVLPPSLPLVLLHVKLSCLDFIPFFVLLEGPYSYWRKESKDRTITRHAMPPLQEAQISSSFLPLFPLSPPGGSKVGMKSSSSLGPKLRGPKRDRFFQTILRGGRGRRRGAGCPFLFRIRLATVESRNGESMRER